MESIRNCTNCKLHCYQKPLLDKLGTCDILWVGLSAKMTKTENEPPLSEDTVSGALIRRAEERIPDLVCRKTNLVKCVPLDTNGRLRYPKKQEIDACFCNLEKEIRERKPKIVFLLGTQVAKAVARHLQVQIPEPDGFCYQPARHNGTLYIHIHHPSYVSVYRRKDTEKYLCEILRVAKSAKIREKEDA